MKKKYLKLLLLALSLITIPVEVNAQDDLKKSKFSNQIKEHLSLKKFELAKSDIQNLYVDSEYLSKKTQECKLILPLLKMEPIITFLH